MKKFAIWRMKMEGKALQHIMSMLLFAVLVVGDYWSDKLSDMFDNLADILTDIVEIRSSTANTVVSVFGMYVLILFCEHFIKFGVNRIAKLFKKSTTQTEVSE